MPSPIRSFPYGNLQAYKMYIRPNLLQVLFGSSSTRTPKNKHAENIIHLLCFLAKNQASTTWDVAKEEISSNMERLRTREKEYRRLIIGRNDKSKHNSGLLDLGLVVQDGFTHNRAPAALYRLSLHGILCCIDILDMDKNGIDKIAANYSKIVPKVFGKWDFLKSIIGQDVYKIKILSKGLILDNMTVIDETDPPLFEIMSFIHTKYKNKLENIEEHDLAEQIALWFYTNLLYQSILKKNQNKTKLAQILNKDKKLNLWYNSFLKEVKEYHKTQYYSIKKFTIS